MTKELNALSAHTAELTADEMAVFHMAYSRESKSPGTALVLAVLLPGVDRLYMGQMLLGLLKLFTLGGLTIWWIVDWFWIKKAVRGHNARAARRISMHIISKRSKLHGP